MCGDKCLAVLNLTMRLHFCRELSCTFSNGDANATIEPGCYHIEGLTDDPSVILTKHHSSYGDQCAHYVNAIVCPPNNVTGYAGCDCSSPDKCVNCAMRYHTEPSENYEFAYECTGRYDASPTYYCALLTLIFTPFAMVAEKARLRKSVPCATQQLADSRHRSSPLPRARYKASRMSILCTMSFEAFRSRLPRLGRVVSARHNLLRNGMMCSMPRSTGVRAFSVGPRGARSVVSAVRMGHRKIGKNSCVRRRTDIWWLTTNILFPQFVSERVHSSQVP